MSAVREVTDADSIATMLLVLMPVAATMDIA